MENQKIISKNTFFLLIKILVTLALIIFLFYKIGINNILSTLSNTSLFILLVCFIISIGSYFITPLIYFIFINNLNFKIKFKFIFTDIIKTNVLTVFTPARIGQLYIIKLLQSREIPTGIGTSVFIVYKLLNYLIISTIGLLGIFFLFHQKNILICISIIIGLVLFVLISIISDSIRERIKTVINNKILDKFKGFSKNFKMLIFKNNTKLLQAVALNLFNRFLIALIFFLLFNAYNNPVKITKILLISNIVEIIAAIPLSLNGLGIREGAGIYFYGLMGITNSAILSTFIVYNIIRYLTLVIVYLFSSSKKSV